MTVGEVSNIVITRSTMNHNLNVIRRHRNPLLVVNLLIIGATLLSATVLAEKFSPPVWKAKAKFNVPNTGGNLSADLGTLGSINDSSIGFSKEVNPLQIQSTIMTSDAVINKALEKDPERDEFSNLNSFKGLFVVEPLPQSTVIAIEARGSNSDLATVRAKNLALAYQERLNELRYADADFRQEFTQKEFREAQDNLQKAQEELAEFRRATGIIDPNAQSQQLVASIDELKTKLTLLKSEAEGGQTKAAIAANYFDTTPEQAIQLLNLVENQEYQQARQKLTQAETELSDARSQYQDSSPQVQNLLSKREQLTQELEQKIGAIVPGVEPQELVTLGNSGSNKRLDLIAESLASQADSQGLQRQTVQIQSQIDRLTDELNNISANKAKLAELERKHDIAEGVYKGIVAQSNRSKIDNFNSYPNVQLIDGPILDPEPETPSKKLILLGGVMASLFGSVSLVLFLESASPLLSPKDLVALEFPILFSVARLKQPNLNWNTTRRLKQGSDNDLPSSLPDAATYLSSTQLPLYEDGKVVENWQNSSFTQREFERLATIFSSLTLDNRRVMITSATAGEGKTTVTLGLAIALRKLGYRVLVVDGDLQKSSLSQHLGVSPEASANCANCVEVSFPDNADYQLDLMPAPTVPTTETARFFTKGRFERSLDRLQAEEDYDYVLVDTPPVNLTNEAMLMAPIIGNVLFVVRPGTSDRHAVMDSLEQLKLHKAQIQGLILNAVDSSSSSYRYGYYPSQAALPAPSAPQTV